MNDLPWTFTNCSRNSITNFKWEVEFFGDSDLQRVLVSDINFFVSFPNDVIYCSPFSDAKSSWESKYNAHSCLKIVHNISNKNCY